MSIMDISCGMQLKTWLQDKGVSYAEFARRIGASNGKVVQRYAERERMPEPTMMTKIVEATDGAVQPNDFYDLPAGAVA